MEFLALFNFIPPTPWQEESGDWKQKRFNLLMGLQEGVWAGAGTRGAATAALLPVQRERPPLQEIFVCQVVNTLFVCKTVSVLYTLWC